MQWLNEPPHWQQDGVGIAAPEERRLAVKTERCWVGDDF